MFSGKTEELIRRLKRAEIANQIVEIYKPSIDRRYHNSEIISHDANRIPSLPVETSQNIFLLASDAEVVGVDEAQFFDENLPEVLDMLAARGTRVIVAGLDMDFTGKPFGPVPDILAKAEYITKLHAICQVCGDSANFSYRRPKIEDKVLLGEKDIYEARCRTCFHTAAVQKE